MNHPFSELLPEYVQLLATMQVDPKRAGELDTWAKRLTNPQYWARYEMVQTLTSVPAEFIAALDYRESDASSRCALGQGDLWSEVSRHYPTGCGPFKSWVEAAVYYLHRLHLDDNSSPWSWPYLCWKGESWNGFGPRAQGIHTGYLWAATNHYLSGKYYADHQWSAAVKDEQLGIVPLMIAIANLKGIKHDGMPAKVQGLGPKPMPAPAGLRPIFMHDIAWLQTALNKIMLPPGQLVVDGIYGARTRAAVWDYQNIRDLTVDGLYGAETDASLMRDISA